MKISRIDVIGQNGNDGAAYDGLGAEWLAQSGLLDEGGAGSDRSGQDRLLDQMEVQGPDRSREAAQGQELLAAVPETARDAVVAALKARAGR